MSATPLLQIFFTLYSRGAQDITVSYNTPRGNSGRGRWWWKRILSWLCGTNGYVFALVLTAGCRMKYGVDKDSPSNWDQPDEVYEILSKPTRQGAARIKEARRKATLLD